MRSLVSLGGGKALVLVLVLLTGLLVHPKTVLHELNSQYPEWGESYSSRWSNRICASSSLYSNPARLASYCQCCFLRESRVLSKQWYFSAYLAALWVEMGWYLVLSKVVYFSISVRSLRQIRMLRLEAVKRQQQRLNQLLLWRRSSMRLRRVLSWSRSIVILRQSRQEGRSVRRKDLNESRSCRWRLSVLWKDRLRSKAGVLRSSSFYFLCWSKSWGYSISLGMQFVIILLSGSLAEGWRKAFCIFQKEMPRIQATNQWQSSRSNSYIVIIIVYCMLGWHRVFVMVCCLAMVRVQCQCLNEVAADLPTWALRFAGAGPVSKSDEPALQQTYTNLSKPSEYTVALESDVFVYTNEKSLCEKNKQNESSFTALRDVWLCFDNYYLIECNQQWSLVIKCGTFIQFHKPFNPTILAEMSLDSAAWVQDINGVKMANTSLRGLCAGTYHIWFVYYSRQGRFIKRVKPIYIKYPSCVC